MTCDHDCMLLRVVNKDMPFVLDEGASPSIKANLQLPVHIDSLSGDVACIVILAGAIARALYYCASLSDVNKHN